MERAVESSRAYHLSCSRYARDSNFNGCSAVGIPALVQRHGRMHELKSQRRKDAPTKPVDQGLGCSGDAISDQPGSPLSAGEIVWVARSPGTMIVAVASLLVGSKRGRRSGGRSAGQHDRLSSFDGSPTVSRAQTSSRRLPAPESAAHLQRVTSLDLQATDPSIPPGAVALKLVSRAVHEWAHSSGPARSLGWRIVKRTCAAPCSSLLMMLMAFLTGTGRTVRTADTVAHVAVRSSSSARAGVRSRRSVVRVEDRRDQATDELPGCMDFSWDREAKRSIPSRSTRLIMSGELSASA